METLNLQEFISKTEAALIDTEATKYYHHHLLIQIMKKVI